LINTGNAIVDGSSSVAGDTTLTGRQITLSAADGSSTVTIPSLAINRDDKFATIDSVENIGSSKYLVNDYNQALEQVDNAISSVGALAAAISSIPSMISGSAKKYGAAASAVVVHSVLLGSFSWLCCSIK